MPNPRKWPEPPPLHIRQFTTPQEIDQSMVQLKRRVAEVKALATDQVSYQDERRRTAEQNIHNTILEIFGQDSPQFRQHRYHEIWSGGRYLNMEEDEIEERFRTGIPNTVKLLQGLINSLEEKKADLGFDATARVRTAFEGLDLH